MIFGKYINRYYLKHAPVLLLGLAALLTVDYIQLLIPQLYRLVINGVNLGQVVVKGETMPFTREVLFQHICLPMIWIVVLMVIGRFLWRICFFGTSIRVQADLRERMFDHSRRLSQQYYQVNKVGNLMSLYTNDLDTIQECFGDGVLMFFDALTLGLLALYKMWTMDVRLTLLALIPALIMFVIGTQMSKVMTRRWEERQEAFSGLSDFAQENFSGIAVIKAFVKEYKELQAFRKLNKENEEIKVIKRSQTEMLERISGFTAEEAKEWHERGEKVILVRLETSPEDIEGMKAAQGILTVRGGMTSHAAVVARGMGKCCVSGCGAIVMDEENKQFTLAGKTYHEGDWLSLDGSTGNIYDGAMPTVDASVGGDFGRIMAWADKYRRLQVRTNADTPHDAAKARELGAQGIGLCRTEHMFFEADRIPAIREMICSDTVEQREKALAKLEPMQQGDFEGIYEAMEGCPVTIRFLDPPLHEFVPTEEADIELLAKDMGKTVAEIKAIIASLHEFNPMMGHRGCRLAVTYPEIAAMQTRAVIKAALNVSAETGCMITPHIMIPLVGEVKELKFVKDVVVKVADELIAASGVDMKYLVGTMIEIPRAALTAGDIAKEAEFFSFGTNDLTQMTFGFSRDDAAKFLGAYYENKIYESDPFQHLDQIGVGKLVKMAAHDGRETRPDLGLGICGEHGGDPSSVEFCHKVGLDYVSCSPFRVPIARLAAAQAAIKDMQ